MATTITAPVAPTPASGQQSVEQYAQSLVGQPLPDVTGACTTSGGSVKVEVIGPDGESAWVVVTATLTAYTTAGVFGFIPDDAGLYEVKVTDVTAGQVATSHVEVFQSE